jgi:hypothetical protein
MTAKRNDRVAPPPGPDDWDVRFHDNAAAKDWEEVCRKAPGNALAAWLTMRTDPAPVIRSARQQLLKDRFAVGAHAGRLLDQWQIEVTGGGRIWYLVDDERRTVWVTYASLRHPRETE